MLVGRDLELATLASAVREGRPVVVTGEPGMGKSTLAHAALAASGCRWRAGGAFSVLSWMPYLPLQRALGADLGAGATTTPGTSTPADARSVAVEVEHRLDGAALVVDDLQWADASTVQVVHLLAGRIPLLVVARHTGEGAAVVAALARAGFDRLHVDPLPADDVERIVRARRPEVGPRAIARLVRRSGGNPLILEQLLAAGGEPPASLRLAVAARLRELDEAATTAFELLALAERPLPRGTFDAQVERHLVDAGLATDDAGMLAVRHALLADEAMEVLPDGRRREHHRTLARLLAADPGSAARHHHAAGDRAAARAAALEAAAAARHPISAARHLAVAAECTAGAGAAELRLRAATGLLAAGEMATAEDVLGDEPPQPADLAATWHLLRSRASWASGDMDGFVRHLHDGLAVGERASPQVYVRLRIEALREEAFLHGAAAVPEQTVDRAREALRLALARGVEEARARSMLGTILYLTGNDGWAEQLGRARQLAREEGDVECELISANNLVTAHESAGHPAAGREVVAEMVQRCGQLRARAWEHQFRALLVNLQMHAGELEAAVRDGVDLLGEALELRTRQQLEISVASAQISMGQLDLARRRLDELLEAATDDWMGRANVLFLLAELELAAGRPKQARQHAAAAGALTPSGLRDLASAVEAWASFELKEPPPRVEPLAPGEARTLWELCRDEAAGMAMLATGDHGGAADVLAAAAERYATLDVRWGLRCRLGLGIAMRELGDIDGARTVLLAVEGEAARRGMRPLFDRVRRELRTVGVRRAAPRRSGRSATGLTAREEELVELVGQGLTDAEIARRLGLAPATVKTTIRSAMTRLGATSRGQAVLALAS